MKQPADPLRAQYLQLCEDLLEHAQLARNYAMKPGNAWLARSELNKVGGIMSALEALLDDIKAADEAA